MFNSSPDPNTLMEFGKLYHIIARFIAQKVSLECIFPEKGHKQKILEFVTSTVFVRTQHFYGKMQ